MQIVIDIPSAFIDHFRNDRFYDALMRLSSDAHLLAGLYEQETAAMLIKAFENAVAIPEHGRLVDADKLEETMDDRYSLGEIGRREHDDVVSALRYNAPTVLPKEE